jgi:ABC-type iron transport system FetAB permease component
LWIRQVLQLLLIGNSVKNILGANIKVYGALLMLWICFLKTSARWNSEVRNRPDPTTTEKLAYIFSNRMAVAAATRHDELKMCACDNE